MITRAIIAILCSSAVYAADILSYADRGIAFTLPGTGLVILSWPELSLPNNKTAKATATTVDGQRATLTYADGTVIATSLNGGTLTMTLSQAPAEAKSVRIACSLPMSLVGATWTIGDTSGAFPAEKPAKPFLFQGSASGFAVSQGGAKRVGITVPQWSFQQLQDNREWKTNSFWWMAIAPINKDNLTMSVVVETP